MPMNRISWGRLRKRVYCWGESLSTSLAALSLGRRRSASRLKVSSTGVFSVVEGRPVGGREETYLDEPLSW